MTKKVGVIGGGPGGYVAAIRLAQLGADVVIVEKDKFGGTCLNRGCIPTKAYAKSAELMNQMKRSEEFGLISESQPVADGEKLLARKADIVNKLVTGIEQLLSSYENIKVYRGLGSLVNNTSIKIKTEDEEILEENFDAIVLANGSKPIMPSLPGLDLEGVISSDELLDLDHVPESLVVIGGGVIGLEFASIYKELGSEVFVLSSRVLKNADGEISKRCASQLKKQKIKLYNDIRAQKIEKVDGKLEVTAKYKTKDKEEIVRGDYVLVASGRGPVFDGLGQDLGLEMNKGGLLVDKNFKTNLEGVYAIGDIVAGNPQLAHVASAQGEYVAEVIMGQNPEINLEAYPSCVFTLDEIAYVGQTEEELKEKDIDYVASKFNFVANGKALCGGDTTGFVKVLADPEGKLLGAHIIGPHASDLIAELALAQANGLGVKEIIKTIHAHPTLAEATMEAAAGVFGQAIHVAKPRR
ncbi:MAG: dihydrolipoyl dehydrogenase [Bacillota bacterium]|nr:dihydrolipoyl dehydrogenase [Bacillota bacterium]